MPVSITPTIKPSPLAPSILLFSQILVAPTCFGPESVSNCFNSSFSTANTPGIFRIATTSVGDNSTTKLLIAILKRFSTCTFRPTAELILLITIF